MKRMLLLFAVSASCFAQQPATAPTEILPMISCHQLPNGDLRDCTIAKGHSLDDAVKAIRQAHAKELASLHEMINKEAVDFNFSQKGYRQCVDSLRLLSTGDAKPKK